MLKSSYKLQASCELWQLKILTDKQIKCHFHVVQYNRNMSLVHFKSKRPYNSSIFVCAVRVCVFISVRVHRYTDWKPCKRVKYSLTVTEVRVLSHSGSAAECLYQNEMNMSRWKPVGHTVWYRPMKVRPDGQWGS